MGIVSASDSHKQEGEVKRVSECGDCAFTWLVFSTADICLGGLRKSLNLAIINNTKEL